jgi:acetolactate synthase-1/2/3 large subunit
MPVATGAAIAAWTQAREQLNVTTIILNNHSYAILSVETHRVGADLGGPAAGPLLDLSSPNLNFTKIAEGMGVPATRARTCDELAEQLRHALTEPGPHLINAIVPGVI